MALYPKLTRNGSFNSITKEYLQRYMRVNGWYTGFVDAQWGKMSWQGLQRMCKYHGYYTGYIDGSPGPMTKKAFNRFLFNRFPNYNGTLNSVDYGVYEPFWSSRLVKYLQNGLNIIARYDKKTYPKVYHV